MKMLDTNYALRFILRDNEETAQLVRDEIISGAVFVSDAVLAEVVYVLSKVYKIERNMVSKSVLAFVEITNVITQNQKVVRKCMQYYSETSFDFVDCLLAAYHYEEDHEICTFDKKLKKFIECMDSEK